ncbi:MAG: sulfurtransferase TusA family protein [Deltaproteobacteria bacterium]|nr:sulfurtransferase TusA family protein [Deltaproteobacteria bacterium]
MNENEINLEGKICPFPVMHIVREVDMMKSGETLKFFVDDPLAIKSVPEELEEIPGISVNIIASGRSWEIIVTKA